MLMIDQNKRTRVLAAALFFASALVIALLCSTRVPVIKHALEQHALAVMEQAYGSRPLAPEHTAKIQTIAAAMNVPFDSIIIRTMNTAALQQWGYHNAVACFHLFLNIVPLTDTPFLFISESFFENLSTQEQEFLIGHELVHIKEKHTIYLTLMTLLGILLCMIAWRLIIGRYIERRVSNIALRFFLLYMTASACSLPPVLGALAYRRAIEWEADRVSTTLLGTHQGGIAFVERLVTQYSHAANNDVWWGLLADHPSNKERRDYLLAQHAMAQKTTALL